MRPPLAPAFEDPDPNPLADLLAVVIHPQLQHLAKEIVAVRAFLPAIPTRGLRRRHVIGRPLAGLLIGLVVAETRQEEVPRPSPSPVARPIFGLPLPPIVTEGHLDLQADAVATSTGKGLASPDAALATPILLPSTPQANARAAAAVVVLLRGRLAASHGHPTGPSAVQGATSEDGGEVVLALATT